MTRLPAIYNCTACGCATCEDMAIDIYNGLNVLCQLVWIIPVTKFNRKP
jgi:ArsR family metal-binding transcriptional regulator